MTAGSQNPEDNSNESISIDNEHEIVSGVPPNSPIKRRPQYLATLPSLLATCRHLNPILENQGYEIVEVSFKELEENFSEVFLIQRDLHIYTNF